MEDSLENCVDKTEKQNSPPPADVNRDLNAEWESFEKSIGLSFDESEAVDDRKAADRQSSGSRSMSMESSPDHEITGKSDESGSSSSSSSRSASPEPSPEKTSIPSQKQVFPEVLANPPEEPKVEEHEEKSHSQERRQPKPDEKLKQNERRSSKSPKRKRSKSPRHRSRSRSRSPKRRRRSRSRGRRSRSRERERRGRYRRRSRSPGRKRDSSPASTSRRSEERQRPASLKSRKSASTDDQSLISRDKKSASPAKPSPDTTLEDVATTLDCEKDKSLDVKSEGQEQKSMLDDEKEKTCVSSDKEVSKSPEKKRSRSRDKKRSTSRDRKRSRSRDRKRRSSRDRRRSRSRDRRRSRSQGRRSRSRERRRSSRDRVYSSSRRHSRSRDRGYFRKQNRSHDGGRRPPYPRDKKSDADLKAKKDSKFEMKRMEKCKRLGIETGSSQDPHKTIMNLQREQPSDLPLNFASGSEGQNTTVAAAMEEMHKKVVEMTGIQLPKYYNPAAVNPLKYAEQMQKRKLLWSGIKKKDEEAPPTGTQWQATMKLNDDKQSEKFRKLMGLKEDEKEKVQTDGERLKREEELFRGLDEQYEIARMSTHTHRGVGLGFSSQPPQFPR